MTRHASKANTKITRVAAKPDTLRERLNEPLAPVEKAARALAVLRDLAERAGVPIAEALRAFADHSVDEVFDELESLAGERLEADARRWRTAQARFKKVREAQAKNARAASKAHDWAWKVDHRREGLTKEAMYRSIERVERLQPGTVKKAVLRLARQQRG